MIKLLRNSFLLALLLVIGAAQTRAGSLTVSEEGLQISSFFENLHGVKFKESKQVVESRSSAETEGELSSELLLDETEDEEEKEDRDIELDSEKEFNSAIENLNFNNRLCSLESKCKLLLKRFHFLRRNEASWILFEVFRL